MTAVTGNRGARSWAAGFACLLSLLSAGCGGENYYGRLEKSLLPSLIG